MKAGLFVVAWIVLSPISGADFGQGDRVQAMSAPLMAWLFVWGDGRLLASLNERFPLTPEREAEIRKTYRFAEFIRVYRYGLFVETYELKAKTSVVA